MYKIGSWCFLRFPVLSIAFWCFLCWSLLLIAGRDVKESKVKMYPAPPAEAPRTMNNWHWMSLKFAWQTSCEAGHPLDEAHPRILELISVKMVGQVGSPTATAQSRAELRWHVCNIASKPKLAVAWEPLFISKKISVESHTHLLNHGPGQLRAFEPINHQAAALRTLLLFLCLLPLVDWHQARELRQQACALIFNVIELSSSSSSSSFSSFLLLLRVLLLLFYHLCLHFHVHCCLANSWPSSSPTSELSAHGWTSTWDLPSSVRTAGPQPRTFLAQRAPLDLNLGPAELSAHRWTSTWGLPSSVRTAGPPDRMPEDMPDRMSDRMREDMPNKMP